MAIGRDRFGALPEAGHLLMHAQARLETGQLPGMSM